MKERICLPQFADCEFGYISLGVINVLNHLIDQDKKDKDFSILISQSNAFKHL